MDVFKHSVTNDHQGLIWAFMVSPQRVPQLLPCSEALPRGALHHPPGVCVRVPPLATITALAREKWGAATGAIWNPSGGKPGGSPVNSGPINPTCRLILHSVTRCRNSCCHHLRPCLQLKTSVNSLNKIMVFPIMFEHIAELWSDTVLIRNWYCLLHMWSNWQDGSNKGCNKCMFIFLPSCMQYTNNIFNAAKFFFQSFFAKKCAHINRQKRVIRVMHTSWVCMTLIRQPHLETGSWVATDYISHTAVGVAEADTQHA